MTSRRAPVLLLLVLVGAASVRAAAPAAPANLRASVSGSTVSLSWDAPTGPPPGRYVLEASLTPAGPLLATLPTSATSLMVADVPPGTYFVRVRASNADGFSAPSSEIAVTVGPPTACTAPPGVPTRLRGNVDVTRVDITWAPGTGCPATSYVVRAGTSPGAANLAQVPVPSNVLSTTAPNGTFFVDVVAVNAFGQSAPSPSVIVTVVAPTAGGRVEFNNPVVNILVSASGEAVIVGEVVNRSLVPAVFVEVTASFRNAQNQEVGTRSTFVRGIPRRLSASGVIDDSALAPGELGCFYLPTTIPVGLVNNALVGIRHDTLPSTAMTSSVRILDLQQVPAVSPPAVIGEVINRGPATTVFNAAILYFQRVDGRATACDFSFVTATTATLPGGITTNTVLLPRESASFSAPSQAPPGSAVLRGWMQWLELNNDPLSTLATQTYDAMQRAPQTESGRREAIAAWEALQQQRRALARSR